MVRFGAKKEEFIPPFLFKPSLSIEFIEFLDKQSEPWLPLFV